MDARVLAFSFGLVVVTGFLFGLAPAIHTSAADLNESLKEGSRGSGGAGRRRLRSGLVILEVALSVALLAGAGVLLRSFWLLQNVNPGFEPSQLLTARLYLPPARYPTPAQSREFYGRVLESARALPGVRSAALSSNVPLAGGNTGMQIVPPGDPSSATKPFVDWRIVGPDYFKTLGIPLRGRDFGNGDLPDAPAVVIVSQEMAARYFPGQDALGKSFQWMGASAPNRIVGIAGNVRNASLDAAPRPVVYMPLSAHAAWNPMILTLQTAADPAAQASGVRSAIMAVDPNVPVYGIRTGQELLDSSLDERRFRTFLLGCFAGLALLLSTVGLFSVMAYLVTQRTREIGIRLSLGAGKAAIFRLVVGQGMLLALAGSGLGLIGAFALGRWLQDLLFGVGPADPAAFAGAVLLLLGVALLACYGPARRATRVDPLIALHHE
jgi:putative ABC transport system permease protein